MADRDAERLIGSLFLPGLSWRRVFGMTFVGVVAITLVGRSMVGPFALDHGDVLYGQGEPAAALHHWSSVGRWHPLPSVRIAADLRAAAVAETVLGDREAARRMLRRVVERESPPRRVLAVAWARLAALMAEDGGRMEDAVAAWRTALRLDPEAAEAHAWRVATAEALGKAGHLQDALLAWDAVLTENPGDATRVHLAQGALLLAADDVVGALEAYVAAARTDHPGRRQAAHLGVATARARLGEVQGALADLKNAGLPEPVAAARARALGSRAGEDMASDAESP